MLLVRALILALAIANATGITDLLLEVACADACEEDDCDACPPACPTCSCAARAPVGLSSTAAAVTAPRRHARPATHAPRGGPPAAPDPREILHVPIARPV